MAKQAQAVAVQQPNAVVELSEAERYALQHAGAGVSSSAEENIIPLLVVLQPLSPQVLARNPAQIEGAKPGDLWLRNAPTPIINGEVGVIFQPCHRYLEFVEWLPRPPKGPGGFVGRHEKLPVTAFKDPTNANKWLLPRGDDNIEHELIETRHIAGIAWTSIGPLPFDIPFTSTGHTVAKAWNGAMLARKLPTGEGHPAWAHRYTIKSRLRTKGDKSWFVLEPVYYDSLLEPFDKVKLNMGEALHQAFKDRTVVAETTQETGDEHAGSGEAF